MSKPTLFPGAQRSAEEIEQRRKCINVAQTYYNALEKAYNELIALEKINDKAAVNAAERKVFEDLFQVVDRCYKGAPWEISLFFRGIGNELNKLHARLHQELTTTADPNAGQKNYKEVLQPGIVTVYISLYQTDGNSMRKWAQVLNNLTRLSIGRPVYKDAQAIRDIIRAKKEPRNDAYVAVNVKEESIISPLGGIPLRDRMNNELLTVRENAIVPENILEFVHTSGSYRFIDGELVLMENK